MRNLNPSIEWVQKSGKTCLRFVFGEMLTASEAEIAIQEWKAAFQSKIDESIVLLWDCKRMRGYENAARAQWILALKEMKSQIHSIWLITDSAVIKLGAAIMGSLTAQTIKAVSCESEVVF